MNQTSGRWGLLKNVTPHGAGMLGPFICSDKNEWLARREGCRAEAIISLSLSHLRSSVLIGRTSAASRSREPLVFTGVDSLKK